MTKLRVLVTLLVVISTIFITPNPASSGPFIDEMNRARAAGECSWCTRWEIIEAQIHYEFGYGPEADIMLARAKMREDQLAFELERAKIEAKVELAHIRAGADREIAGIGVAGAKAPGGGPVGSAQGAPSAPLPGSVNVKITNHRTERIQIVINGKATGTFLEKDEWEVFEVVPPVKTKARRSKVAFAGGDITATTVDMDPIEDPHNHGVGPITLKDGSTDQGISLVVQ